MINFDQVRKDREEGKGSTKVKWTLEQDLALLELKEKKVEKATIAALVGHPENSIDYRYNLLLTGKTYSMKLKKMVAPEGYIFSPETVFAKHKAEFKGRKQYDAIVEAFLTSRQPK